MSCKNSKKWSYCYKTASSNSKTGLDIGPYWNLYCCIWKLESMKGIEEDIFHLQRKSGSLAWWRNGMRTMTAAHALKNEYQVKIYLVKKQSRRTFRQYLKFLTQQSWFDDPFGDSILTIWVKSQEWYRRWRPPRYTYRRCRGGCWCRGNGQFLDSGSNSRRLDGIEKWWRIRKQSR